MSSPLDLEQGRHLHSSKNILLVLCVIGFVGCATFTYVNLKRKWAWESLIGKKTLTVTELNLFKGFYGAPIYISLSGIVFDVTKGADFYAAGKTYHVYAGRESGRALGHMSLGKPVHAIHLDRPFVGDLDAKQRKVLIDWIVKFKEKYPIVATLDTGQSNDNVWFSKIVAESQVISAANAQKSEEGKTPDSSVPRQTYRQVQSDDLRLRR